MNFKKQWTPADFKIMDAAILNYFRTRTMITREHPEGERLRTYKAIDERLGLAYTSSSDIAGYFICNTEIKYNGTADFLPANQQHFEYFAISEDGQPFACIQDSAEREEFINLNDNGRKYSTLQILAKEWFDKVNGNSYFSAQVYADNELILTLPYQYGYGTHYIDEAAAELEKAGYMLGRRHYANSGKEALWQYCDRMKIKLLTSKSENCKKRDLITREELAAS